MIASVLHIGRADPSTRGYEAARDLGAGRPSEWRPRGLSWRQREELARVEERPRAAG